MKNEELGKIEDELEYQLNMYCPDDKIDEVKVLLYRVSDLQLKTKKEDERQRIYIGLKEEWVKQSKSDPQCSLCLGLQVDKIKKIVHIR